MTGPGRFLLVTADFGGNVPPMLGLGRLLRANGHHVRVIAPRSLERRVNAAGCVFLPLPTEIEWDPAKGKALEDQRDFWIDMGTTRVLPDAIDAAISVSAADVLVVDCMLDNAQWAAERSGLPSAVLVHSLSELWTDLSYWEAWADWIPRANAVRAELGLSALPNEPSLVPLWKRLNVVLISIPEEFDAGATVPDLARYVGPIFEEDPRAGSWTSPWPDDDDRPLVVVSLGSTYMHHEDVVDRVAQAVSSLPARVLLATGFGIDPERIDAPPNMVVERYVPHVNVLPHAALVVTHAGMGTVLAACAYGVPMLCVPLGRDQPDIAERVVALGCGRAVDREADPPTIHDAVVDALGSAEIRAGAARMAEVLAAYGAGSLAIQELESLLPREGGIEI